MWPPLALRNSWGRVGILSAMFCKCCGSFVRFVIQDWPQIFNWVQIQILRCPFQWLYAIGTEKSFCLFACMLRVKIKLFYNPTFNEDSSRFSFKMLMRTKLQTPAKENHPTPSRSHRLVLQSLDVPEDFLHSFAKPDHGTSGWRFQILIRRPEHFSLKFLRLINMFPSEAQTL